MNLIQQLDHYRKLGLTDEQIKAVLASNAEKDPELKLMQDAVNNLVDQSNGREKKHIPGDNPVDVFNRSYSPAELIAKKKSLELDDEDNILCAGELFLKKDGSNYIRVPSSNSEGNFPVRSVNTPFQVLCEIQFGGSWKKAMSYIEIKYITKDIPYIRVRTHYFKRVKKVNTWGCEIENIVPWTKEAIKDDNGVAYLDKIPVFDDFTIYPDNVEYKKTHNGMWNLYEPFPHKPHRFKVSIDMIPTSARFMAHVFGEQIEQGYKYMKLLYENPMQILPVLVLVSRERQTGKTAFLNWMDILFANNYTQIAPEDLNSAFNSQYSYKNIIGIDEAVIDRQGAIEKIKAIATARTIQVNQKMVAQYRIPFYGKIIITTNRETDFMRIDSEEIRFWVRKLESIPSNKMESDFFDQLIIEAPLLLRYLADMEPIEFGRSRMVFTKEEISNDHLNTVKAESRSGLHKELEILIYEWFKDNEHKDELYMRLKDIKEEWFRHDNRISRSYIQKVVEEEMGSKLCDNDRYCFFNDSTKRKGTPYQFKRGDYCKEESGNMEISNKSPF